MSTYLGTHKLCFGGSHTQSNLLIQGLIFEREGNVIYTLYIVNTMHAVYLSLNRMHLEWVH